MAAGNVDQTSLYSVFSIHRAQRKFRSQFWLAFIYWNFLYWTIKLDTHNSTAWTYICIRDNILYRYICLWFRV